LDRPSQNTKKPWQKLNASLGEAQRTLQCESERVRKLEKDQQHAHRQLESQLERFKKLYTEVKSQYDTYGQEVTKLKTTAEDESKLWDGIYTSVIRYLPEWKPKVSIRLSTYSRRLR